MLVSLARSKKTEHPRKVLAIFGIDNTRITEYLRKPPIQRKVG